MSDNEIAKFQLAQLNIGCLRHPRDTLQMHDFCEALGSVGHIALNWPGFIWIHDNAETIGIVTDLFGIGMVANLSIWRDIESLRAFMECPEHAAVMKRRNEWFVPMAAATFVLWWIPAGYIPNFMEGQERLTDLYRCGPCLAAFDLDAVFPPPDYS
jgi:hypothetical protein